MPYLRDSETGEQVLLSDELYEEWCKEMADFNASACTCSTREVRRRMIPGRKDIFMEQCLTCGQGRGGAIAHRSVRGDEPPWDDKLAAEYEAARKSQSDGIYKKAFSRARDENTKIRKSAEVWRQEYATYRRSERWQKKRVLVLKRAGGICEGCLSASAEVVHHTTYRNMGNELLFELVALCHSCHDLAHPEHTESFYDQDYSPCVDCRWAEGRTQCGRFGVPQFVALSASGECGAKWHGFEGLK